MEAAMDPVVDGLLCACVTLLILVLAGLSRLQKQAGALTRIEAKLDLLLGNENLTYEPLANVPAAVADAIQRGEKIEAIKLYREATGVGLKEAKDYVEEIQRKSGTMS
jgi:ribosomal protein L7/L12